MQEKYSPSFTHSLLQSEEWAHFQESLGKQVFHISEKSFTYFAILEHTRLGSYLYLPYGPVIDEKKPKSSLRQALKSLQDLAQEHHCLFVRIEPRFPFDHEYLKSLNLIKSHDLNPADTWVLDLDLGATEIIPSRLLRYHKKMSNNHLEVITSHDPSDLHHLVDLQTSLMSSKNLNSYDINYYKKQLAAGFATLYLLKQTQAAENPSATPETPTASNDEVTPEPTVLAAGLVFDHSGTRYNLQGAQSDLGRSLHATGILTVQLILDAISSGETTFDFWGIAPDGAPKSHPWAGFTGFKKTFTGTPLHFSGTYDLPIKKPKYHLYQLLRALNRLKRKLH